MIVSPAFDRRLVLADAVEHERGGAGAVVEDADRRQVLLRRPRGRRSRVGDQRHARLVRRSTFEIVPTRPSFVITTSLSLIPSPLAGRDRDALVERRRAREHARADLVVVLREARPLDVVQELLELDVLLRRRPSSCALMRRRRAFSAAQLLVLRLRVEEPVRPVGRVAERVRHPVRGDLERPQRRGRRRSRPDRARVERNETVSRASESTTRPTTTNRRLRGLERVEEWPEAAARWTEEPRTATRTFRLRGTSEGESSRRGSRPDFCEAAQNAGNRAPLASSGSEPSPPGSRLRQCRPVGRPGGARGDPRR